MKRVALASKKQPPPHDPAITARFVDTICRGPDAWNAWRRANPDVFIDLRDANLFKIYESRRSLRGINLSSANISGAFLARLDLSGADLSAVYGTRVNLQGAVLDGANLSGAFLRECDLDLAKLRRADLRVTDLTRTGLLMTDFQGANLRMATLEAADITEASFEGCIMTGCVLDDAVVRGSNMRGVNLADSFLLGTVFIETDLRQANLTGARIYGASAWNVTLTGAVQANLVITPSSEPDITVDNLKVAQFLYLLLNNEEIRDVFNTITGKMVLILGRFSLEQKPVLDAIRSALRKHDYNPILFDFERPATRGMIETVQVLAGMSRFVVADLTTPKLVLEEVPRILQSCPSVPIVPVIRVGDPAPRELEDFSGYPSFMGLRRYRDVEGLLNDLFESVIQPAEAVARDLAERTARNPTHT